jgi:hypothetical protein
VIVNHVALLAGDQGQPAAAVTLTVLLAPAAGAEALAGLMAYVHPARPRKVTSPTLVGGEPPPVTLTWFTTSDGGFVATFTTTVIGG